MTWPVAARFVLGTLDVDIEVIGPDGDPSLPVGFGIVVDLKLRLTSNTPPTTHALRRQRPLSCCRKRVEERYHGAFTPRNGIEHLRSTSSSLNGRTPWPFSWTAAVAQHFLMSALIRNHIFEDGAEVGREKGRPEASSL